MKLKLIDVKTDWHEVEFGTCELCFSTGFVDEPVFVFEDTEGNQFEVDGYWWSWGDYDEVYIDNLVDFAAWIAQQDFPEDTADTWLNSHDIFSLVDDYDAYRRQEEQ